METKKCACKDHQGDPILEANFDNFSRDASSRSGFSSWCKVCQNRRYEPKNTGALDSNDFMTDPQGRLVHVDLVKEIDKTRDELVRHLVRNATRIQSQMVEFKENALSEIEAFVDLSAQEYDVTWGGKKGNMSFLTYDGKFKVQVQISEYLACDERLQVAKKMVDECMSTWTEDSRAEIKTIINDVFAVNQEGKINIRRVLSLRRYDIKEPLWQKAMQAISDSVHVAGSKSYMRIYERIGKEDRWRNISLDMAAL